MCYLEFMNDFFTNTALNTFLKLVLIYFIGTIPFSVIFSKYILKQDIRNVGSGNIGVSNAYRAGGFLFSLLIATFDLGRGFLVAKYIMPGQSVAILALCLGQMFPITLKFKGGKGVACYLGSLIAINSQVGLAFTTSWLLITTITKMPFLSSMIVLIGSMFFIKQDPYLFILYALIIFRHKQNFIEFFGKYRKS